MTKRFGVNPKCSSPLLHLERCRGKERERRESEGGRRVGGEGRGSVWKRERDGRQFKGAICLSAKPGNDSLSCYEVAEIFYTGFPAQFLHDVDMRRETSATILNEKNQILSSSVAVALWPVL